MAEPSASAASSPRVVYVPYERMEGWFARYDAAHPGTVWRADARSVSTLSPDGTAVSIQVPVEPMQDASVPGLLEHLAHPRRIGVLLVRKGGFAVARLDGTSVTESKIGRRHVQGRTKAGGWSQHRFARRRDNQARAAYDAAADYVHAILAGHARRLDLLACGGDRQAVGAVLDDRPELSGLRGVPRSWLGGFADPTRAVLNLAVERARSVHVAITDPPDHPASSPPPPPPLPGNAG